ncbi:MAG: hypothetical protein K2X69_13190 [Silvanigrellaceae bacterium]|nr:hypothetical protein [Silvanigrellaceae bacterium]
MKNVNVLFGSISIMCLVISCGGENALTKYGSANDACSLQIDSTTWQVSSTPNQNIFPITNSFASVQASTLNCGSLFSGSNNIQISVNFKSPVNNLIGQELALVSFSVGSKSLIQSDTSLNFITGNLKGTIVDSRTNSNWKPPFSDPGFMTFTFQIPTSIIGQTNSYPTGIIYFDQVN